MSLSTFLAVFVGGGLGSVLRYSLTLLATIFSAKVWIATLVANIFGAFVIGVFSYKMDLNPKYAPLLRIGLLGGLTTFSTFSFQVVDSFKAGNIFEAGLILFLNIFFGIVVSIWVFR